MKNRPGKEYLMTSKSLLAPGGEHFLIDSEANISYKDLYYTYSLFPFLSKYIISESKKEFYQNIQSKIDFLEFVEKYNSSKTKGKMLEYFNIESILDMQSKFDLVELIKYIKYLENKISELSGIFNKEIVELRKEIVELENNIMKLTEHISSLHKKLDKILHAISYNDNIEFIHLNETARPGIEIPVSDISEEFEKENIQSNDEISIELTKEYVLDFIDWQKSANQEHVIEYLNDGKYSLKDYINQQDWVKAANIIDKVYSYIYK